MLIEMKHWECAECRREIPAGQGPLCSICQSSHRGPVVVLAKYARRPTGSRGFFGSIARPAQVCPVCFTSATKGQNCRKCGVMISIE